MGAGSARPGVSNEMARKEEEAQNIPEYLLEMLTQMAEKQRRCKTFHRHLAVNPAAVRSASPSPCMSYFCLLLRTVESVEPSMFEQLGRLDREQKQSQEPDNVPAGGHALRPCRIGDNGKRMGQPYKGESAASV